MKKYIGTKIVYAEQHDKEGVHGYKVMYKDGYISWSPAHAFEEAYRLFEEMDFDVDDKFYDDYDQD